MSRLRLIIQQLSINVGFPIEELNMQPYLAPNSPSALSPQLYDLYGVVVRW